MQIVLRLLKRRSEHRPVYLGREPSAACSACCESYSSGLFRGMSGANCTWRYSLDKWREQERMVGIVSQNQVCVCVACRIEGEEQ